jgi:small subunit ribosomal protein S4e
MVKKLKRLLSPKFWKLSKKEYKWVVSPKPGPHPKFYSIPLQVVVKEILGLVETGKEAKTIIRSGEILVDGIARKDHGYPAGLFDVIAIPKIKKYYRIVPKLCLKKENELEVIEIPESESKKKICKILNKTMVSGKIQLNLSDGKNILTAEKKYKTGDTVLLEVPSLKILDHIPLAAGNIGIVSKGKSEGKIGKIKSIIPGNIKEIPKIVCDIDGKKQQILKDRFFVIGKEKSVITVGG